MTVARVSQLAVEVLRSGIAPLTGDITLSALTLSGAAGVGAAGDATLELLTLDANSGAVAQGSATLPGLTLAGAAHLAYPMSGAVDLGAGAGTMFALTGAMTTSADSNGDSFFPELVVEGGLDPALAWPELALSADAVAGTVASGRALLTAPLLEGGIDAGVRLPAFTLAASGEAAALITGQVQLAPLKLAGSLAPALALPLPGVAGTLLAGTVAAASCTLPDWTVAADWDPAGALDMPAWTLAAAALAGSVADGHATFGRLAVDARHYQDTVAAGAVLFGVLTADGTAGADNLIAAQVSLPRLTLAGLALSGARGSATLTLPLVTLHAAGHSQTIGQAAIELPVLLVDAVGGARRDSTAVTTIALNTQLAAVTRFDALPANSFARFGGVTLAATADGIVALMGDTDLGQPIAATLVAGVSDYGSDSIKRIIAGYVGYRASGSVELTLIADGHDEYVYPLAPRRADGALHPARVKFGRGAEGRYWQWKLANLDGADFSVDSLGLDVETLSRKVR
jgi:hypothetical protein